MIAMVLKANQVCPKAGTCKYAQTAGNYCRGIDSTRETDFVCDLVTESGEVRPDGFRSSFDETGKMKILHN
jgi:hypothetical protein